MFEGAHVFVHLPASDAVQLVHGFVFQCPDHIKRIAAVADRFPQAPVPSGPDLVNGQHEVGEFAGGPVEQRPPAARPERYSDQLERRFHPYRQAAACGAKEVDI